MITIRQQLTLVATLAAAMLTTQDSFAQATGGSARTTEANQVHCYHAPRSRIATCTPDPVDTLAVEAEARRLTPQAGLLTVYIVRQRWSDVRHVIDLHVGVHRVGTVPSSFVRVRLPPGEHQISFDWQGRTLQLPVSGRAGEVKVVELAGSMWAWGATYEWATDDEAGARERVQRCRLVADLVSNWS
jgi:hypothetical protein